MTRKYIHRKIRLVVVVITTTEASLLDLSYITANYREVRHFYYQEGYLKDLAGNEVFLGGRRGQEELE